MEFIQPLPQAIVQLTFPTLAQTLAEGLAASGVADTNTSGTSAAVVTETAMTTGGLAGALASLDTSQGVFVAPFDFA